MRETPPEKLEMKTAQERAELTRKAAKGPDGVNIHAEVNATVRAEQQEKTLDASKPKALNPKP